MSDDYSVQVSISGFDADGRSVMYNVRGKTKEEFDGNLKHVKETYHLEKLLGQRGALNVPPPSDPGVAQEETPICGIHHTAMTKRQRKDGSGSFWSCGRKLDDGTWCPYKPQKK